MTEHDAIFKDDHDRLGDFRFEKKVAKVFDDMVNRSVPWYFEIQRMIAELAADHAQQGSDVYDLGCATGATLLSMDRAVDPGITFVGVDDSEEMRAQCREKLAQARLARSCVLEIRDLNRDVVIENASVVVCLVLPTFFYIFYAIVTTEELYLSRRFGDTYRTYCQQVPRWRIRWQGT
ncbi:MAG: hypothetical protein CVV27_19845 [Candidatus Melainabacteria bacterium HGW-Melainabacteria-1]|nr:MAG: hypothetical protein CVV27_19845 [Candidatus Melainabacteria bacterium HGW-Melainabacteria-1]PKM10864.1 MAG: hypothetical protein CVV13_11360 [Gammaproteobacteria bacterium HGW-Gammaproteobacteria-3]